MEGEKQQQQQQQLQEQLKCPRCESENTKFCYYNNYNLSQPRHFCKDCRRYWTKGGTLRNIPVGGGTRKNSKRPAAAVAADDDGGSNPKRISAPDPAPDPIRLMKPEPISVIYPSIDHDSVFGMTGSFSSLLSSSWNFGGNLMDARHSFESGIGGFPPSREEIPFKPELQSSNDSSGSENPTPQLENLMGLQGDSSCWTGGWPDLSIYTPGSSFQ